LLISSFVGIQPNSVFFFFFFFFFFSSSSSSSSSLFGSWMLYASLLTHLGRR
jgi:hypothetical protein